MWVVSKGAFHDLAPGGMFVDVVVCIPFRQIQVMVSPVAAFTVLGVNERPDTMTRWSADDAAETLPINNAARRRIFFIVVLVWVLHFETIFVK